MIALTSPGQIDNFATAAQDFVSEETEFFIEFPAGPLAVGNEPVEKLAELQFETGKLRLLSPTDCVKDRLSAYYHWGDRQCLQQAVWVAQMKPIDWIEVEPWSRQEGATEKFVEFRAELQDSSAVPASHSDAIQHHATN